MIFEFRVSLILRPWCSKGSNSTNVVWHFSQMTGRLDNRMSIYLSKLMHSSRSHIKVSSTNTTCSTFSSLHGFLQFSHRFSRCYSCWQCGSYTHQETSFLLSSQSMPTSFRIYDSVNNHHCHSETHFHSHGSANFHDKAGNFIEHLINS